MAVTTKDLARICGVSRATVTRALHGAENIKPTTKQMILDKAKELGYQPNLVARSLVNGRSYIIGVVVVELGNLYFPKIVDSVGLHAKRQGYMVSICIHEDDKNAEKRLIRMLKGYHADGLILNCINKSERFEKMLQELDIPYVILGYKAFKNSYTVGIDDYESGYQAGKFVIEKGYRTLAFVAPPMYDVDGEYNIGHVDRFRGYEAAAQEENVPCTLFYGEDYAEQVLAYMQERNGAKPMFLCSGDIFAGMLLKRFWDAGYTAPQDFGIMGYDNTKVYQNFEKPLATVDNHADLVGLKAAEMLIDLIEGRAVEQHQKVDFEIIDGKTIK